MLVDMPVPHTWVLTSKHLSWMRNCATQKPSTRNNIYACDNGFRNIFDFSLPSTPLTACLYWKFQHEIFDLESLHGASIEFEMQYFSRVKAFELSCV